MNRWGLRWSLGWLAVWACAWGVFAQTNRWDAQFEAGNRQVAEGHYAEGLAAYSQVGTAQRTSAALEYNRGVAHTRLGNEGQARAHWLRAARLQPRNPAIQAALEGSEKPNLPAFAPPSVWSWTDRLTLNEWGVLALIPTWIWGALLIVGRLNPGLGSRLQGYTFGVGLIAVLLVGLLTTAWARRVRLPDAVILASETTVRISPLEEARTAFTLAGGTAVKTRSQRQGWSWVEEPLTRRMGWVRSDQLLPLPLY
jgi:tetratricopeptide (TPR) repeat protein